MAMQANVVSNTPTRKLELRVKSRIAIMQARPLCGTLCLLLFQLMER